MINREKIILLTTLIFFFIFSLTHAQMDFSKPLTREQARKLIEDRLFDIKVSDIQAIELTQKIINTDQEPEKITLNIFAKQSESSELEYLFVWNLSFGYPENKEVLIDGNKGTILLIKDQKYQKIEPLGILQNPLYLGLFSIIGILTVILLFRFSMRIFFKESSE